VTDLQPITYDDFFESVFANWDVYNGRQKLDH